MYGYVEAAVIPDTAIILKEILQGIGIETMPVEKMHMTLMYDERNVILNDPLETFRYLAVPKGVMLLGEGKWQAVALELYAPKAIDYHNHLKSVGFQHSYPDFLPHMSLKYAPPLREVEMLMQISSILADVPLFFELQPFKATTE